MIYHLKLKNRIENIIKPKYATKLVYSHIIVPGLLKDTNPVNKYPKAIAIADKNRKENAVIVFFGLTNILANILVGFFLTRYIPMKRNKNAMKLNTKLIIL